MTITNRIEAFNRERRLLDGGFNKNLEHMMLQEELDELLAAVSWDDHADALCDIIVLATGALCKMNLDPDIAMDETLLEIESRVGEIDKDGKWRKKITGNEYKADYSNAVLR